jgi:hypothetical protein
MKYPWFHAFTTSTTPVDARRVMRGNSRPYRRVALRWTLRSMFNASVLFVVILVVLGNIAVAQELDSATLQKQAEEEAAAKAKQSQPPAWQNQPPQAASSQDQPTTPPQASQQQTSQPPTMQPQSQMPQGGQPSFMLPPGTKLPLGLLRPLRVKPGRDVYLQITFPVTIGNEMVVPPGTYIQGVVGKIIRKDRRRERLEFEVHSASMIFLNGYTVPISGTVTVATANAAWLSPGPGINRGQPVPAMAAVGGVAPPALPPLPDIGKTARTAMIAIGVVGAVAITAGIVIAANRDPEVEAGTPLEIVLPAPVFLDAGRVMAAVQQFNQQASYAPVQIVQPPVKPKMCYDPGSPGTPDTVIPGSPGTPDTVIPGVNGMPDTVIPGSPRTPDTVIPGTPGTPSSSYPCPK